MAQVFISFVEEDKRIAEDIAKALEAEGYSAWFYTEKAVIGDRYLEEISREIEACEAFIILISKVAMGSHEVNVELTAAYRKRKSIIPILRGIRLEKVKERKPDWEIIIGGITCLNIPKEGVGAIIPRVMEGLKSKSILAEKLLEELPGEKIKPKPKTSKFHLLDRMKVFYAEKRKLSIALIASLILILIAAVAIPCAILIPAEPEPGASTSTSEGLNLNSKGGDENTSTPAPAESTLSVGKNSMYRADVAHTGLYETRALVELSGLKWRFKTGEWISTTPVVENNKVYFGSGDRRFYVLDADSGSELWRKEIYNEIQSSPTICNGTVYFGTAQPLAYYATGESIQYGCIYALDTETGAEKWKFEIDKGEVYSSPVVANGILYCGSNDGHLYALDATAGTEIWRFRTGDYIYSSPAVYDGIVYIGSNDRTLYAIDAANGSLVWEYVTDDVIHGSPAISNNTVLVGSYDGSLYAFHADTGELKWKITNGYIRCSPAILEDTVYFGVNQGDFYAVDLETGEEKWMLDLEGPSGEVFSGISDPSASENVLYFGTDNFPAQQDGNSVCHLFAVETETGNLLWTYEVDKRVTTSPAVCNGEVFFGCADGYLYALH